MDLFFFDFDNTLYAYDSMRRLPAQSRLSGVSQYHLAKSWWAADYERRAEAGEWPTSAEYLAQFARITGGHLTLAQWVEARREASTATPGVVDALRRASGLGRVALLSNNPSPFDETFSTLAPDVAAIIGDNQAVSCRLGFRKPTREAFQSALDRFNQPAADTFFVDDSAQNVAGARRLGITAHHFPSPSDQSIADLNAAINAFSTRTR
ncbi:MAG: hydrolase [Glaciihabitans sp.]|nr:hydrolase [Glaciihabitans sp.]